MNYIVATSEQYAGRLLECLSDKNIKDYSRIDIGAGYAVVLDHPHHSVAVDLLRHMKQYPLLMVRTKKSASRTAELLKQEAKAFEKIMDNLL